MTENCSVRRKGGCRLYWSQIVLDWDADSICHTNKREPPKYFERESKLTRFICNTSLWSKHRRSYWKKIKMKREVERLFRNNSLLSYKLEPVFFFFNKCHCDLREQLEINAASQDVLAGTWVGSEGSRSQNSSTGYWFPKRRLNICAIAIIQFLFFHEQNELWR